MTYRLNPIVNLINSQINLVFPNGTMQKYSSGEEVIREVFDRLYKIRRITADSNAVVIELEETQLEAIEDPFA